MKKWGKFKTIKLFNYKTCNKIVTYYTQFKNVSRIFYESFTRLLYRINKYLLAYLDKFMTKTYNQLIKVLEFQYELKI